MPVKFKESQKDRKGNVQNFYMRSTPLEELKAAHAAKDGAQIDAALEKINGAWQAASQEMYAAQGAEGAQGGAQPTGDAGAETTDAEVTDVDFEEVK